MLFLLKRLALAAVLISFCAATPSIRIENLSKQSVCYKVEYSDGTGAFPNNTDCGAAGDQVAGFWLALGQSNFTVKATNATGHLFNGAITAVLDNKTTCGARNEINFSNATMPFYDVDYQYGISDGTCGPLNSGNLSGERDTLGKANKAWRTLNSTTKIQLLENSSQYLRQGANGSLTYINMGIEAWPNRTDVIWFFQVTAGFKAYMGPGSVDNVIWPKNSTHARLVDLADQQTTSAVTDTIVITSY